jgi:antitoxin HicB
MTELVYPVTIEPLPAAEGGGFVAFALDLPGCMSDGETDVEALRNIREAIGEWISEASRLGMAIPVPSRLRQAAE